MSAFRGFFVRVFFVPLLTFSFVGAPVLQPISLGAQLILKPSVAHAQAVGAGCEPIKDKDGKVTGAKNVSCKGKCIVDKEKAICKLDDKNIVPTTKDGQPIEVKKLQSDYDAAKKQADELNTKWNDSTDPTNPDFKDPTLGKEAEAAGAKALEAKMKLESALSQIEAIANPPDPTITKPTRPNLRFGPGTPLPGSNGAVILTPPNPGDLPASGGNPNDNGAPLGTSPLTGFGADTPAPNRSVLDSMEIQDYWQKAEEGLKAAADKVSNALTNLSDKALAAYDSFYSPKDAPRYPYLADDGIFYKDSMKTEIATKEQMDMLKWSPTGKSESFASKELTEEDVAKSKLKGLQYGRQEAYGGLQSAREDLEGGYDKSADGKYTCTFKAQCEQLNADIAAYNDALKKALEADSSYMDYYSSLPPALASDLSQQGGTGQSGPPAPIDPNAVDPQLKPLVEALNSGDIAKAQEVMKQLGPLSQDVQEYLGRTLAANGINIDPNTKELVAPIYANPDWAKQLAIGQEFQNELGQISRVASDQLIGAAYAQAQEQARLAEAQAKAAALTEADVALTDRASLQADQEKEFLQARIDKNNEIIKTLAQNRLVPDPNNPGKTITAKALENRLTAQNNAAQARIEALDAMSAIINSNDPLSDYVAEKYLQADNLPVQEDPQGLYATQTKFGKDQMLKQIQAIEEEERRLEVLQSRTGDVFSGPSRAALADQQARIDAARQILSEVVDATPYSAETQHALDRFSGNGNWYERALDSMSAKIQDLMAFNRDLSGGTSAVLGFGANLAETAVRDLGIVTFNPTAQDVVGALGSISTDQSLTYGIAFGNTVLNGVIVGQVGLGIARGIGTAIEATSILRFGNDSLGALPGVSRLADGSYVLATDYVRVESSLSRSLLAAKFDEVKLTAQEALVEAGYTPERAQALVRDGAEGRPLPSAADRVGLLEAGVPPEQAARMIADDAGALRQALLETGVPPEGLVSLNNSLKGVAPVNEARLAAIAKEAEAVSPKLKFDPDTGKVLNPQTEAETLKQLEKATGMKFADPELTRLEIAQRAAERLEGTGINFKTGQEMALTQTTRGGGVTLALGEGKTVVTLADRIYTYLTDPKANWMLMAPVNDLKKFGGLYGDQLAGLGSKTLLVTNDEKLLGSTAPGFKAVSFENFPAELKSNPGATVLLSAEEFGHLKSLITLEGGAGDLTKLLRTIRNVVIDEAHRLAGSNVASVIGNEARVVTYAERSALRADEFLGAIGAKAEPGTVLAEDRLVANPDIVRRLEGDLPSGRVSTDLKAALADDPAAFQQNPNRMYLVPETGDGIIGTPIMNDAFKQWIRDSLKMDPTDPMIANVLKTMEWTAGKDYAIIDGSGKAITTRTASNLGEAKVVTMDPTRGPQANMRFSEPEISITAQLKHGLTDSAVEVTQIAAETPLTQLFRVMQGESGPPRVGALSATLDGLEKLVEAGVPIDGILHVSPSRLNVASFKTLDSAAEGRALLFDNLAKQPNASPLLPKDVSFSEAQRLSNTHSFGYATDPVEFARLEKAFNEASAAGGPLEGYQFVKYQNGVVYKNGFEVGTDPNAVVKNLYKESPTFVLSDAAGTNGINNQAKGLGVRFGIGSGEDLAQNVGRLSRTSSLPGGGRWESEFFVVRDESALTKQLTGSLRAENADSMLIALKASGGDDMLGASLFEKAQTKGLGALSGEEQVALLAKITDAERLSNITNNAISQGAIATRITNPVKGMLESAAITGEAQSFAERMYLDAIARKPAPVDLSLNPSGGRLTNDSYFNAGFKAWDAQAAQFVEKWEGLLAKESGATQTALKPAFDAWKERLAEAAAKPYAEAVPLRGTFAAASPLESMGIAKTLSEAVIPPTLSIQPTAVATLGKDFAALLADARAGALTSGRIEAELAAARRTLSTDPTLTAAAKAAAGVADAPFALKFAGAGDLAAAMGMVNAAVAAYEQNLTAAQQAVTALQGASSFDTELQQQQLQNLQQALNGLAQAGSTPSEFKGLSLTPTTDLSKADIPVLTNDVLAQVGENKTRLATSKLPLPGIVRLGMRGDADTSARQASPVTAVSGPAKLAAAQRKPPAGTLAPASAPAPLANTYFVPTAAQAAIPTAVNPGTWNPVSASKWSAADWSSRIAAVKQVAQTTPGPVGAAYASAQANLESARRWSPSGNIFAKVFATVMSPIADIRITQAAQDIRTAQSLSTPVSEQLDPSTWSDNARDWSPAQFAVRIAEMTQLAATYNDKKSTAYNSKLGPAFAAANDALKAAQAKRGSILAKTLDLAKRLIPVLGNSADNDITKAGDAMRTAENIAFVQNIAFAPTPATSPKDTGAIAKDTPLASRTPATKVTTDKIKIVQNYVDAVQALADANKRETASNAPSFSNLFNLTAAQRKATAAKIEKGVEKERILLAAARADLAQFGYEPFEDIKGAKGIINSKGEVLARSTTPSGIMVVVATFDTLVANPLGNTTFTFESDAIQAYRDAVQKQIDAGDDEAASLTAEADQNVALNYLEKKGSSLTDARARAWVDAKQASARADKAAIDALNTYGAGSLQLKAADDAADAAKQAQKDALSNLAYNEPKGWAQYFRRAAAFSVPLGGLLLGALAFDPTGVGGATLAVASFFGFGARLSDGTEVVQPSVGRPYRVAADLTQSQQAQLKSRLEEHRNVARSAQPSELKQKLAGLVNTILGKEFNRLGLRDAEGNSLFLPLQANEIGGISINSSASYDPLPDKIAIRDFESIAQAPRRFKTLLHEAIHQTGATTLTWGSLMGIGEPGPKDIRSGYDPTYSRSFNEGLVDSTAERLIRENAALLASAFPGTTVEQWQQFNSSTYDDERAFNAKFNQAIGAAQGKSAAEARDDIFRGYVKGDDAPIRQAETVFGKGTLAILRDMRLNTSDQVSNINAYFFSNNAAERQLAAQNLANARTSLFAGLTSAQTDQALQNIDVAIDATDREVQSEMTNLKDQLSRAVSGASANDPQVNDLLKKVSLLNAYVAAEAQAQELAANTKVQPPQPPQPSQNATAGTAPAATAGTAQTAPAAQGIAQGNPFPLPSFISNRIQNTNWVKRLPQAIVVGATVAVGAVAYFAAAQLGVPLPGHWGTQAYLDTVWHGIGTGIIAGTTALGVTAVLSAGTYFWNGLKGTPNAPPATVAETEQQLPSNRTNLITQLGVGAVTIGLALWGAPLLAVLPVAVGGSIAVSYMSGNAVRSVPNPQDNTTITENRGTLFGTVAAKFPGSLAQFFARFPFIGQAAVASSAAVTGVLGLNPILGPATIYASIYFFRPVVLAILSTYTGQKLALGVETFGLRTVQFLTGSRDLTFFGYSFPKISFGLRTAGQIALARALSIPLFSLPIGALSNVTGTTAYINTIRGGVSVVPPNVATLALDIAKGKVTNLDALTSRVASLGTRSPASPQPAPGQQEIPIASGAAPLPGIVVVETPAPVPTTGAGGPPPPDATAPKVTPVVAAGAVLTAALDQLKAAEKAIDDFRQDQEMQDLLRSNPTEGQRRFDALLAGKDKARTDLATAVPLSQILAATKASDLPVGNEGIMQYPINQDLRVNVMSDLRIVDVSDPSHPIVKQVLGGKTVADVVKEFGSSPATKGTPIAVNTPPAALPTPQKTSPEAQCVTADTKLRRRKLKKGEKGADKDGYIYDDVMIKDIVPGDEIASMDPISGVLVYSRVNALINKGVQTIYQLTTQSNRRIRTTDAHPYFVRTKYDTGAKAREIQKLYRFEVDMSMKIENYSADSIIAIANTEQSFTIEVSRKVKQTLRDRTRHLNKSKRFLPAVFALGIVEALRNMETRVHELVIDTDYLTYDALITRIIHEFFPTIHLSFDQVGKHSTAHLAAYKVHKNKKAADMVAAIESFSIKTENALRATFSSNLSAEPPVGPQASSDMAKVHEQDEIVKKGEWTIVKEIREGQMIAVTYGNRVVWEKIVKIDKQAPERVYDIEIEGTHNFIGNDIVAHNTQVGSTPAVSLNQPQPGEFDSIAANPPIVKAGPVASAILDQSQVQSDEQKALAIFNANFKSWSNFFISHKDQLQDIASQLDAQNLNNTIIASSINYAIKSGSLLQDTLQRGIVASNDFSTRKVTAEQMQELKALALYVIGAEPRPEFVNLRWYQPQTVARQLEPTLADLDRQGLGNTLTARAIADAIQASLLGRETRPDLADAKALGLEGKIPQPQAVSTVPPPQSSLATLAKPTSGDYQKLFAVLLLGDKYKQNSAKYEAMVPFMINSVALPAGTVESPSIDSFKTDDSAKAEIRKGWDQMMAYLTKEYAAQGRQFIAPKLNLEATPEGYAWSLPGYNPNTKTVTIDIAYYRNGLASKYSSDGTPIKRVESTNLMNVFADAAHEIGHHVQYSVARAPNGPINGDAFEQNADQIGARLLAGAGILTQKNAFQFFTAVVADADDIIKAQSTNANAAYTDPHGGARERVQASAQGVGDKDLTASLDTLVKAGLTIDWNKAPALASGPQKTGAIQIPTQQVPAGLSGQALAQIGTNIKNGIDSLVTLVQSRSGQSTQAQLAQQQTVAKMTTTQVGSFANDTVNTLNTFWTDYFAVRGATFKPITAVPDANNITYDLPSSRVLFDAGLLQNLAVTRAPNVGKELIDEILAHEIGHAFQQQAYGIGRGIGMQTMPATSQRSAELNADWIAGFSLAKTGIVAPNNAAKVAKLIANLQSPGVPGYPTSAERERAFTSGFQTALNGGEVDKVFAEYPITGLSPRITFAIPQKGGGIAPQLADPTNLIRAAGVIGGWISTAWDGTKFVLSEARREILPLPATGNTAELPKATLTPDQQAAIARYDAAKAAFALSLVKNATLPMEAFNAAARPLKAELDAATLNLSDSGIVITTDATGPTAMALASTGQIIRATPSTPAPSITKPDKFAVPFIQQPTLARSTVGAPKVPFDSILSQVQAMIGNNGTITQVKNNGGPVIIAIPQIHDVGYLPGATGGVDDKTIQRIQDQIMTIRAGIIVAGISTSLIPEGSLMGNEETIAGDAKFYGIESRQIATLMMSQFTDFIGKQYVKDNKASLMSILDTGGIQSLQDKLIADYYKSPQFQKLLTNYTDGEPGADALTSEEVDTSKATFVIAVHDALFKALPDDPDLESALLSARLFIYQSHGRIAVEQRNVNVTNNLDDLLKKIGSQPVVHVFGAAHFEDHYDTFYQQATHKIQDAWDQKGFSYIVITPAAMLESGNAVAISLAGEYPPTPADVAADDQAARDALANAKKVAVAPQTPAAPAVPTALPPQPIEQAQLPKPGAGPSALPPQQASQQGIQDSGKYVSLAQARAPIVLEIQQDSDLRRLIMASTQAEVGGQGPVSEQAYIESAINRNLSEKSVNPSVTLRQTLSSLYNPVTQEGYYPATTINKLGARFSSAEQARMNVIIDAVLAGSNISNLATGNESGPNICFGNCVPVVDLATGKTMQWTFNPGRGERFVLESPTVAWRNDMLSKLGRPGTTLPGATSQSTTLAQALVNQGRIQLKQGEQMIQTGIDQTAASPTYTFFVYDPAVESSGHTVQMQQVPSGVQTVTLPAGKITIDRVAVLAPDVGELYKQAIRNGGSKVRLGAFDSEFAADVGRAFVRFYDIRKYVPGMTDALRPQNAKYGAKNSGHKLGEAFDFGYRRFKRSSDIALFTQLLREEGVAVNPEPNAPGGPHTHAEKNLRPYKGMLPALGNSSRNLTSKSVKQFALFTPDAKGEFTQQIGQAFVLAPASQQSPQVATTPAGGGAKDFSDGINKAALQLLHNGDKIRPVKNNPDAAIVTRGKTQFNLVPDPAKPGVYNLVNRSTKALVASADIAQQPAAAPSQSLADALAAINVLNAKGQVVTVIKTPYAPNGYTNCTKVEGCDEAQSPNLEGELNKSRKTPMVRTLVDVVEGKSWYITLAGGKDQAKRGDFYFIPTIEFISPKDHLIYVLSTNAALFQGKGSRFTDPVSKKTYVYWSGIGYVHDIGGAFPNGTAKKDIPVAHFTGIMSDAQGARFVNAQGTLNGPSKWIYLGTSRATAIALSNSAKNVALALAPPQPGTSVVANRDVISPPASAVPTGKPIVITETTPPDTYLPTLMQLAKPATPPITVPASASNEVPSVIPIGNTPVTLATVQGMMEQGAAPPNGKAEPKSDGTYWLFAADKTTRVYLVQTAPGLYVLIANGQRVGNEFALALEGGATAKPEPAAPPKSETTPPATPPQDVAFAQTDLAAATQKAASVKTALEDAQKQQQNVDKLAKNITTNIKALRDAGTQMETSSTGAELKARFVNASKKGIALIASLTQLQSAPNISDATRVQITAALSVAGVQAQMKLEIYAFAARPTVNPFGKAPSQNSTKRDLMQKLAPMKLQLAMGLKNAEAAIANAKTESAASVQTAQSGLNDANVALATAQQALANAQKKSAESPAPVVVVPPTPNPPVPAARPDAGPQPAVVQFPEKITKFGAFAEKPVTAKTSSISQDAAAVEQAQKNAQVQAAADAEARAQRKTTRDQENALAERLKTAAEFQIRRTLKLDPNDLPPREKYNEGGAVFDLRNQLYDSTEVLLSNRVAQIEDDISALPVGRLRSETDTTKLAMLEPQLEAAQKALHEFKTARDKEDNDAFDVFVAKQQKNHLSQKGLTYWTGDFKAKVKDKIAKILTDDMNSLVYYYDLIPHATRAEDAPEFLALYARLQLVLAPTQPGETEAWRGEIAKMRTRLDINGKMDLLTLNQLEKLQQRVINKLIVLESPAEEPAVPSADQKPTTTDAPTVIAEAPPIEIPLAEQGVELRKASNVASEAEKNLLDRVEELRLVADAAEKAAAKAKKTLADADAAIKTAQEDSNTAKTTYNKLLAQIQPAKTTLANATALDANMKVVQEAYDRADKDANSLTRAKTIASAKLAYATAHDQYNIFNDKGKVIAKKDGILRTLPLIMDNPLLSTADKAANNLDLATVERRLGHFNYDIQNAEVLLEQHGRDALIAAGTTAANDAVKAAQRIINRAKASLVTLAELKKGQKYDAASMLVLLETKQKTLADAAENANKDWATWQAKLVNAQKAYVDATKANEKAQNENNLAQALLEQAPDLIAQADKLAQERIAKNEADAAVAAAEAAAAKSKPDPRPAIVQSAPSVPTAVPVVSKPTIVVLGETPDAYLPPNVRTPESRERTPAPAQIPLPIPVAILPSPLLPVRAPSNQSPFGGNSAFTLAPISPEQEKPKPKTPSTGSDQSQAGSGTSIAGINPPTLLVVIPPPPPPSSLWTRFLLVLGLATISQQNNNANTNSNTIPSVNPESSQVTQVTTANLPVPIPAIVILPTSPNTGVVAPNAPGTEVPVSEASPGEPAAPASPVAPATPTAAPGTIEFDKDGKEAPKASPASQPPASPGTTPPAPSSPASTPAPSAPSAPSPESPTPDPDKNDSCFVDGKVVPTCNTPEKDCTIANLTGTPCQTPDTTKTGPDTTSTGGGVTPSGTTPPGGGGFNPTSIIGLIGGLAKLLIPFTNPTTPIAPPSPYGIGTDGQSCTQPPAQPTSACANGTWRATSGINGCTTGWQCVPNAPATPGSTGSPQATPTTPFTNIPPQNPSPTSQPSTVPAQQPSQTNNPTGSGMTGEAFFIKLGMSGAVPIPASGPVSLVVSQIQLIAGAPPEAPQLLQEAPTAPTLASVLQGVSDFLRGIMASLSSNLSGSSTFRSNDLSGVTAEPTFGAFTISSVLSGIVNFLRAFLTPFSGQ
ncbi:hypothetical protein HY968_03655 [Candidatus Kaiserbacteria bacterium]|nr:hypothetical protein [Candidatus Kaiserbacteria bacterium]